MNPAIVIQKVSRNFGNLVALDGLSFTVQSGEVFGLLGPNGAGKTTTINLITGLLHRHNISGDTLFMVWNLARWLSVGRDEQSRKHFTLVCSILRSTLASATIHSGGCQQPGQSQRRIRLIPQLRLHC